jgi:hypothetical protein
LRPLRFSANNGLLKSLAVMVLEGPEGTPVAVGAIRVYVSRLPDAARQRVLERREPFGTIIRSHHLGHSSHPAGYFRVTPDAIICDALGVSPADTLYGRRNTIRNAAGEALAEVLEILPPPDLRGPR